MLLVAFSQQGCGLFHKKTTVAKVDTAYLEELYYTSELAYLAGNQADAKKGFAEFIKKSPHPASGFYRLACIEQNAGNPNTGIAYIVKAIENEPNNSSFYLKHCEFLISMKLYSEAGDKLFGMTTKFPRYYSYYRDAAYYKKLAGEYAKGLEYAKVWENQFGFVEEIAMAQIDLNKRNKDSAGTIAVYKRLILKYPERRQYKKQLAEYYQSQGNFAEANRINESLSVSNSPNFGKIAECKDLIEKGDFENWLPKAKIVLADGSLTFADQRSVLPSLENSKLPAAILDSTELMYLQLCKRYPDVPSIQFELTDHFLLHEKYLQAIPVLSKYLSETPSDLGNWKDYLNCLYQLNMAERMTKAADSLMQLYPVLTIGYINLVKANLISGNPTQGTENVESGMSYVTDESERIELQLLLARCLALTGKLEEAKIVNQTLLQQNPNAVSVLLGMANFEFSSKNFAETEKWIKKAEVLDPKNLEVEIFKLRFLIDQKKASESLTLANNLLISHPNLAPLQELAGDANFLANNKTEAVSFWKKALNNGLTSKPLLTKIQLSAQ